MTVFQDIYASQIYPYPIIDKTSSVGYGELGGDPTQSSFPMTDLIAGLDFSDFILVDDLDTPLPIELRDFTFGDTSIVAVYCTSTTQQGAIDIADDVIGVVNGVMSEPIQRTNITHNETRWVIVVIADET